MLFPVDLSPIKYQMTATSLTRWNDNHHPRFAIDGRIDDGYELQFASSSNNLHDWLQVIDEC